MCFCCVCIGVCAGAGTFFWSRFPWFTSHLFFILPLSPLYSDFHIRTAYSRRTRPFGCWKEKHLIWFEYLEYVLYAKGLTLFVARRQIQNTLSLSLPHTHKVTNTHAKKHSNKMLVLCKNGTFLSGAARTRKVRRPDHAPWGRSWECHEI